MTTNFSFHSRRFHDNRGSSSLGSFHLRSLTLIAPNRQRKLLQMPFPHLRGRTVDDAGPLGRHLGHALPDQGEVVAPAKALLQEERGAAAAQLAVGDDGDAVAQDVRLIHVVRGQNDGAACREAETELSRSHGRHRPSSAFLSGAAGTST